MESARLIQKKRTTNFREDETKLLIQLWGSPQVQNKLYLTHRKAPVMRILAASMQQHGFYRTPDEIKTRIRNLKCLYHRIKRSVQSGAGVGTVDPDWPHYKAMDEILTKQNQKKDNPYKDSIFEGPRCEDIKQEIEDIDINDDMESYTTNSIGGSDYEDDSPLQLPPLTPAPEKAIKKEPPDIPANLSKHISISCTNNKSNNSIQFHHQGKTTSALPALLPNLTIPIQNQQVSTSNVAANRNQTRLAPQMPSIPFPLLILNGVQPQLQNSIANTVLPGDKKTNTTGVNGTSVTSTIVGETKLSPEVIAILRELLEVQREKMDLEKERLEIEKQRLEMEKRRLDLEHIMSPQILAFAPLLNELLTRTQSAFAKTMSETRDVASAKSANNKKRTMDTKTEEPRNCKILRSFLEKDSQQKETVDDDDDKDSSDDNDDSGVQVDDGSITDN